MTDQTEQPDAADTELSDLVEQVTDERGADGAAAMADQLRDKLPQTAAIEEEPGESED